MNKEAAGQVVGSLSKGGDAGQATVRQFVCSRV